MSGPSGGYSGLSSPASGGYGGKGGSSGMFGGQHNLGGYPLSYGNSPWGAPGGGWGSMFGGMGSPMPPTPSPAPQPAATPPVVPPPVQGSTQALTSPDFGYSLFGQSRPMAVNQTPSMGSMMRAPVAIGNSAFQAAQPDYVNYNPAVPAHGNTQNVGWNSGFQPAVLPQGTAMQTAGNMWRLVPQLFGGAITGRHTGRMFG